MPKLYDKLPPAPGVYLMKDIRGRVLYIGKAANLKRRVASYFVKAHDSRIERLTSKIKKIDYERTDTALEALILEAELIKKFSPPFNVREKDDKSFLYIEITGDDFPRVLLTRGRDVRYAGKGKSRYFGPFTSASSVREALRILRRIFPWSVHDPKNLGKFNRPCFDYEIGLCPGTCVGRVSRPDYLATIKKLTLFLEGEKKQLIGGAKKEMNRAGKNLDFEAAEKLRRELFALQHIRDISLITEPEIRNVSAEAARDYRIEGYDISNISGTSAVGSMVVFKGDRPDKAEYRKFRIKTIVGSDDVGMLREVMARRLRNDWPLPDAILVDGGRGQVNAVKSVLAEAGLKVPVVGIAKGAQRRKNEFIGKIPSGIKTKTLIAVRDEAHRFAVRYHKELRGRAFIG